MFLCSQPCSYGPKQIVSDSKIGQPAGDALSHIKREIHSGAQPKSGLQFCKCDSTKIHTYAGKRTYLDLPFKHSNMRNRENVVVKAEQNSSALVVDTCMVRTLTWTSHNLFIQDIHMCVLLCYATLIRVKDRARPH
jgi:hypothetical protein